MIFKQRICDQENARNGWQYIDGITECRTFYDAEHECKCIDLTKDKDCILALRSEAYLLNDDGKTIERVCSLGMEPSREGGK